MNVSHCQLSWVIIFFLHVQRFLLDSLYNLVDVKSLLQQGSLHFILFYCHSYGLDVVVTFNFTHAQGLFWSPVAFLQLRKSASLSRAKRKQPGAQAGGLRSHFQGGGFLLF